MDSTMAVQKYSGGGDVVQRQFIQKMKDKWDAIKRNPHKFLSGEYGQLEFLKEVAAYLEGEVRLVHDDYRRSLDHTDPDNPSRAIAIVVEVVWNIYIDPTMGRRPPGN